MNKIYNPKQEDWAEILKRPTQTIDDIEATVSEVFKEVRQKGDEAIKKYTSLFDGVALDTNIVSEVEFKEASKSISEDLKAAQSKVILNEHGFKIPTSIEN